MDRSDAFGLSVSKKQRDMHLPKEIAAWPPAWREVFEERAGIIEYLGNVSRFAAEVRAEQDVRKIAAEEKTYVDR